MLRVLDEQRDIEERGTSPIHFSLSFTLVSVMPDDLVSPQLHFGGFVKLDNWNLSGMPIAS